MNQQPVIGLTSARMFMEGTFLNGIPKASVNTDYIDAVIKAGGIPISLPPVCGLPEIRRYVELCDGILVTGGMDVSPILYHELPHSQCGSFDLEMDRTHITLIHETIRADKPLLGICRGMQLINVALGGTLYQDIPAQCPDCGGHSFAHVRSDAVHTVTLEEGSPLHQIYGCTELEVNSIHHQSVKDPGTGVKLCAVAPDGVAEGLWVPGKKITAVQWHPEMLLLKSEESLCLFKNFIGLCR